MNKFVWKRKDLLGLEELTADEIIHILDTSKSFYEISTRAIKKVPVLRGKTVVNLFFEPSTRTKTSFELAEKRMSADIINVSTSGSSLTKGETLIDTVKNLAAYKIDILVMRHSVPGSAHMLSKILEASVVNAGDGAHEHPTQGLLDIFTIRQKKGRIENLKVAIVGDILHSRVARSNIWGLTKLGAEVILVGPTTLVPKHFESMGAKISHNFDDIIGDMDVINMLRIQKERQKKNLFPSLREYSDLYGLDERRVKKIKKDAIIMHPGPINRGVEMSASVADGPFSVILDQVTNGLAVRMAVFFLVTGGRKGKGIM